MNLRAQDLPDRAPFQCRIASSQADRSREDFAFFASWLQIPAPYFCNASNISIHKSWDW
jgi:hypothetical protein